MHYIYLASAYSHPDPAVRLERYYKVAEVAAKLMKQGEVVFCPITHSHQIGVALDLPVDHDFWSRQDMPFLVHASELMVLMMDGWRESVGVAAEIALAKQLGIPIYFLTLNIECLEMREIEREIRERFV